VATDLLEVLSCLVLTPIFLLLGSWLPARILAEDRRAVALWRGQVLPPQPGVREHLRQIAQPAASGWAVLLLLGMIGALVSGGGGARALPLALWVATLVTLIRTDLCHRLLPDLLTLPLLWLGLLLQLGDATRTVGLHAAILGAVTGYLPFRLIGEAYRALRGRDGMGQGDMKLLAAIGAWWGPGFVVTAYLLATLLALLWRVPRVVFGREYLAEVFAFGPFIASAALLLAASGILIG
jgi:leader peptidase (prepilin peptidase)/N-methyltransferase